MRQPRKSASLVTPSYEDSGLFKGKLLSTRAELVPNFRHNARGDVLVRGFVPEAREAVFVVFAGRRTRQVFPLLQELRRALTRAKQIANQTNEKLDPDTVRIGISVNGTWRKRFERDQTGWETRFHHLIVAQWAVEVRPGQFAEFGEVPVNKMAAPLAVAAARSRQQG